jgi:hypothetical protein
MTLIDIYILNKNMFIDSRLVLSKTISFLLNFSVDFCHD